MQMVALTDAKARLTSLARLAEGGEEIALTRHGRVVARIVPPVDRPKIDRDALRARMSEISREGGKIARAQGLDARRLQDEIYDDDGYPA